MADASVPPEGQARVRPFDPLVLDKTIIALPLLELMQEDFARINAILKDHPEAGTFNTAIQYNGAFFGGLEGAWHEVQRIAGDAAKRTVTVVQAQMAQVPSEIRPRFERRIRSLQSSLAMSAIGRPLEGHTYGFAKLDAAVVRRLVAANKRLAVPPVLQLGPSRFEIIIDLNLEHPGGREAARQWVHRPHRRRQDGRANVRRRRSGRALGEGQSQQPVPLRAAGGTGHSEARRAGHRTEAHGEAETRRAGRDNPSLKAQIDTRKCRAIFHIWPDFEVSACINKSIATVKADAAQNSFSARGGGHHLGGDGLRHSARSRALPQIRQHRSDVAAPQGFHRRRRRAVRRRERPRHARRRHHRRRMARARRTRPTSERPIAISRLSEARTGTSSSRRRGSKRVSGMAPRCKLVSLRVLDENGKGSVSNLIAAIAHMQEKNGYGRRLLIHGVNMSLGYNFEPEWFACGQSPLCVEVDRLVKTRRRRRRRGRQHRLRHAEVARSARRQRGHGAHHQRSGQRGSRDHRRLDASRHAARLRRLVFLVEGSDRRRAAEAGPGGARRKDHLLRDRHAEAGRARRSVPCDYVETSGTSMAAPHVSGVIAAFLSVRGEFIGQAGAGQGASSSSTRHRPAARPLLPGRRPRRSDARHSVRLSTSRLDGGHHERYRRDSLRRGGVRQERNARAVRSPLPGRVTDLFVISHGWNNDADDAETLYRTFFTNFVAVARPNDLPGRTLSPSSASSGRRRSSTSSSPPRGEDRLAQGRRRPRTPRRDPVVARGRRGQARRG